jgi:hypothetical protein
MCCPRLAPANAVSAGILSKGFPLGFLTWNGSPAKDRAPSLDNPKPVGSEQAANEPPERHEPIVALAARHAYHPE